MLADDLRVWVSVLQVNSVSFSPDGRTLASGSDDKTVKLWDVDTGAVISTMTGHGEWVSDATRPPTISRSRNEMKNCVSSRSIMVANLINSADSLPYSVASFTRHYGLLFELDWLEL